jgi:hypothetical protein
VERATIMVILEKMVLVTQLDRIIAEHIQSAEYSQTLTSMANWFATGMTPKKAKRKHIR